MEWLGIFNNVMEWIEHHLEDEMDTSEIEKMTGCPYRIFQRMFSYIIGISLTEYIRRRKLSEAAYDLQIGKCKVIDVALKYGYESVDAFSAAFKKLHGISPIMAKHENYQLKSYPRVSFSMAIIGGEAMNYRVIRKEKQVVLGVMGSMDDNIWGQVKQDGSLRKLEALGGSSESWGLCFGEDENGKNKYMVAVSAKAKNEKYETYVIEASNWLVFESKGPMQPNLGNTWKRIYGEFMPSSNYKQNPDIPTIEKYCSNDTMAEDYVVEIWIPVLD